MDLQNIVTLIDSLDPVAMAALRKRYPDQHKILSSSRQLGNEKPGETARLAPEQREALIELVKIGLSKLHSQIDRVSASILQRMQWVTRAKLAGATMAALSGSLGAVVAYLGYGRDTTMNTMILSLVSMGGGLSALLADHFEKAPSGVRIASAEEYGKLLNMRTEVDQIERFIERDRLLPMPDDELIAQLKMLDRHSADLIRLTFA